MSLPVISMNAAAGRRGARHTGCLVVWRVSLSETHMASQRGTVECILYNVALAVASALRVPIAGEAWVVAGPR